MPAITPDKLAAEHRQELTAAEQRVAEIAAELHRAEGHRDRLLSRLLDLEGAHDRRFVPVR